MEWPLGCHLFFNEKGIKVDDDILRAPFIMVFGRTSLLVLAQLQKYTPSIFFIVAVDFLYYI
jgi:hypothetical protein